VLIDKLVKKSKINIKDIDCFSISMGPGSYTGLRIGVSTFKGLCFSLKKPLISINSLDLLTESALKKINDSEFYLCPMVDARRMEVFTKMLDNNLNEVIKNQAIGVGPSTAVMILSSLSADELKLAIIDSDVNKIKSVKGIGQKTAERIILELKDKISLDDIENVKLSQNIGNTIRDEALSALSSLGISKNVVERHIDSIIDKNDDINLEDLIKEVLKRS
jgi:Holliday junction DNA helicase RuvA